MNEAKKIDSSHRIFQPACSITEEADKVVVRLEMPGVTKGNLNIHVDHHELIVTGHREAGVEATHYLIRERRVGDFKKTFTVDDKIDPEKIDATLENGLLTLTMGLKASVQPRQIPIKQR